jgi:hypothetical protein
MVIERFFGKGRPEPSKPRAQEKGDAKSRRPASPKPDAEPEANANAGPPRVEAAATVPTPGAGASAARATKTAAARGTVTKTTTTRVDTLPELTHEEIAVRAYDLWNKQGRPGGRERENWIEAERQLRAERMSS